VSEIPEHTNFLQDDETLISGLPLGQIEELPIEPLGSTKAEKGPFLILTNDGIKFAKRWHRSKNKVPPKMSRLYQLIMKIIMMKGVITQIGAQKIGYDKKVIHDAISRRYLRLARKPSKPSREVIQDINKLIGKGRKPLYM
jgi:hypothetical protein